jgi:hypothetical protein
MNSLEEWRNHRIFVSARKKIQRQISQFFTSFWVIIYSIWHSFARMHRVKFLLQTSDNPKQYFPTKRVT